MADKLDPTDTVVLPEPPAPVKPGIKTTEFWLTAAAFALAAAVSLGLVSSDKADAVWKVIGAMGAVFGGTVATTVYTSKRAKIKSGE